MTQSKTFTDKAIANLKAAIAEKHAERDILEYKTIIRTIIYEKFSELLPTYLNNTDIIIPNYLYA